MTGDRTTRLRHRLLVGGLTAVATALAGCAGETAPDSAKTEPDEGGDARPEPDEGGKGSPTSRPASTGLDAFGDPSFEALTAFIPLDDAVTLDLVVMTSPLGRQVGTVEPETGETTAAFTLPGADYPPGLYTVRGYQPDGSGGYDEVAMRQYRFTPAVRIADVGPGREPGTVQLVIENTGTGPYEASQYRISSPDRTPAIVQWNSSGTDPVYALPGESATFGDLPTNFSKQGDRDSADSYCDGTDGIALVFEVRGGATNRTRIERGFSLVADGEASWNDAGIFVSNSYTCTEMRAAK